MKTLIAVVNYPKQSKDFIEYVAAMAIDLKKQVHLVHIEDPVNYPLGIPGGTGAGVVQVRESLIRNSKEVEETLGILVNRVKKDIAEELSIEYSAHVGSVSVFFDKLIDNKNADMIVIEGKGAQDFWTQSPTNMEIIENTNLPVWIIPLSQKYESFKEIVYATDYVKEDLETIKKLVRLTNNYLPRITALHITDNADFEEKIKKTGFQEKVKTETNYDNLSVKLLNKKDKTNIPDLISNYASNNKANLIVVLKENKSFLGELFTTNQTKRIIEKSKAPVLVYHEGS